MSRPAWLPIACVVAGLAAGCASRERTHAQDATPSLPFHLALVPVECAPRAVPGPAPAHPLAIDADAASRDLAQVLARAAGFASVTVLPYPEDRARFLASSAAERGGEWIELARAAGADLLLVSRLEYEPGFETRRNGKFWLNLPLFLLGGPMCYWVNDNTSTPSAKLAGAFHDLNGVYRDPYGLGSERARLLALSATCEEVTMDFVDRAGDRVLPYVWSVFVPAGLLEKQSEHVRDELERRITNQLAEDFGSSVSERRDELLEAPRLVNFWFEPRGGGARWSADGKTIEIEGDVYLEQDEQVQRMTAWRIEAGGGAAEGLFGEPEPIELPLSGSRGVRYELRATLTPPDGAERVRLELIDGHENRNVRSYTLRLPTRL